MEATRKTARLMRNVRPAAPAAGRTSPAACGRPFGHLAAAERAAGADGPSESTLAAGPAAQPPGSFAGR